MKLKANKHSAQASSLFLVFPGACYVMPPSGLED